MGKSKKAKAVRVVVEETAVTLVGQQRKALVEIGRKAASPDRREQIEGLAQERALVADLVGTARERAVMAGLADTVAQAKVRGEQVEQVKGGPVRVGRDSLAELFKRGSITGDQYLGGSAYRPAYEACHSGTRSQLADRTGSGQPDAWQQRRADLDARRAWVEDVVRQAARAARRDPDLAVRLLRQVAGEGAPLNPSNGCSRTKRLRIETLRVALTATAVALKVTGAVRSPSRAEAYETKGEACAFSDANNLAEGAD